MQPEFSLLTSVRDVLKRESRGRLLLAVEVYELRRAALCGVTHDALGQVYGVSQSTVTRAVNRLTYAHVPHPVEEVDEHGVAGYLPYAGAVKWLASSAEDGVVTEIVCRPTRPVSFSAMLTLMDLAEGQQRRGESVVSCGGEHGENLSSPGLSAFLCMRGFRL